MCGIVGYWSKTKDHNGLRMALPAAVAALRHRGPDGQGTWFNDKGVGLGHARLAILDLTDVAAQPMLCRDAEIAITFNGEIYNFKEIAADLKNLGHSFAGTGDTEVILAAYREWGPACVERFIGMFAFAIWDGPQGCLRLFRDRIGVKPLYYGWDGQTFCFASELKALRALPHWRPSVDQTAVGEFLQYGYIAAPRSIYQQLYKLQPGHWLHLGANDAPRITPYWSLQEILQRDPLTGTPAALEAELEQLLTSAFRYRLVSDVPVGLFLSGGIDSSLVATLLRKLNVEIEAFTIGFESAEHDESQSAAAIAKHLGMKHHLARVSLSDASTVLDQWSDLYDEPFCDHSGIPTFLVAQMARQHVKVALSADGGDELFCGYAGYPMLAQRMALHRRVPLIGRRAASWFLNHGVTSTPMNLKSSIGPALHRRLGNGLVFNHLQKANSFVSAANPTAAIRTFRQFWQPAEIGSLLDTAFSDPRLTTAPSMPSARSDLEQIMAMDLVEYLPDDVLAKADRATMAAGLEAREPLLDHRLVEFAFRLPLDMRHGALGNKHVLRSILYRNIPRALVDRPKRGFAVPINQWMDHWLATGAVRDSIDILRDKMPFLNTQWLDGSLHAFAGSPQGKNRLWLTHVLGQWAKRWL
jgi:asparagine synthase (glutamine-hydrolysing)